MKTASIALVLHILLFGQIFCQAESTKPYETDWQLYSPGAFPQGWVLPIDRVIVAYGQVEHLYLVGEFAVTATGKSRSILRSKDYPAFRFIVEYPKDIRPSSEKTTITRTPLRPLLVTDVKPQPNGDINVYLREIIK